MNRRFPKITIGSNLKMYQTNRQTLEFLGRLQELTHDISRSDLTLFILPSFTALADACRAADHTKVWIGAQNMHWEEQGQFTGEISPLMLQEIGVDVVMVGHAERRQYFGETDTMANHRVLSSLAHGFQTLLCVGDSLEDFQSGGSADALRRQLGAGLAGVTSEQAHRLWVAYEPAWAIGERGTVADPVFANEMHKTLREIVTGCFPDRGESVPILYGGSVNLGNAEALIHQPEIDGLFIGRAAWEANRFNQIIRQALAAWSQVPG